MPWRLLPFRSSGRMLGRRSVAGKGARGSRVGAWHAGGAIETIATARPRGDPNEIRSMNTGLIRRGERRGPNLRRIPAQVVVIVGASRGIGRQTAIRFGSRRATLVLSARDGTALAAAANAARAAGAAGVEVITADVTSAWQMEQLARRAIARFGRLDTWVHVSGVDLWSTFEETRPEEFRRVIEV